MAPLHGDQWHRSHPPPRAPSPPARTATRLSPPWPQRRRRSGPRRGEWLLRGGPAGYRTRWRPPSRRGERAGRVGGECARREGGLEGGHHGALRRPPPCRSPRRPRRGVAVRRLREAGNGRRGGVGGACVYVWGSSVWRRLTVLFVTAVGGGESRAATARQGCACRWGREGGTVRGPGGEGKCTNMAARCRRGEGERRTSLRHETAPPSPPTGSQPGLLLYGFR